MSLHKEEERSVSYILCSELKIKRQKGNDAKSAVPQIMIKSHNLRFFVQVI